MSITKKEVALLQVVLAMELTIPSYQRPYKWRDKHVNRLIDDLLTHMELKVSKYRLGTIVLHQETGKKTNTVDDQQPSSPVIEDHPINIVDGQQRLLTLSMLRHFLGPQEKNCKRSLLDYKPPSAISVENLQHNAAHIQRRITALDAATKKSLLDFFLNQCELVCVTLDDISEAFQFFDSQNARGKSLEPFDLLKAFHLREMRSNTEVEQTQCVERWEGQVEPHIDKKTFEPSLHVLMNDVLFPIRRWVQGDSGREFTGEHIGVFKGVSHSESRHRYPHIASLRAVNYAVHSYNTDISRGWDMQHMNYPFQSNQVLINGKQFFDYIAHYTQLYQTLFVNRGHEKLKTILDVLGSENYKGRHRIGDTYVKKLFFCTVLYYYDKFGNYELEKAARLCFEWSYWVRLTKASVRAESIDARAREPNGLLKVISKAVHPHEVLSFYTPPITKVEVKRIDELIDFLGWSK